VEETVAPQQSQITSPDETTEDLSLLPPSPMRPLSTLRDSIPRGMGAGHTMTDFQRKLRNRRLRKYLWIGVPVALCVVLVFFLVFMWKGVGTPQETTLVAEDGNDKNASSQDTLAEETSSAPTKEIALGNSPQKKPAKADPDNLDLAGDTSDKERNALLDIQVPTESDSDVGSDHTDADDPPEELKMLLPYLSRPPEETFGTKKKTVKVEVEIPGWKTNDTDISLVLLGLEALNGQKDGNLSLKKAADSKNRWELIYTNTNTRGGITKSENEVFTIAKLWIDDNRLHFQWNEKDKQVSKLRNNPKRLELFNGMRWCLLLATADGKPLFYCRLSEAQLYQPIHLKTDKPVHPQLDDSKVFNSVLPDFNKANLVFRPRIVGNNNEFSTRSLSTQKYKSSFALSYKPKSQTEGISGERYNVIISIAVVYKAGTTLKESSIIITKELHIPHEIQKTIKPFFSQESRLDKPIFRNTIPIGGNQSITDLRKRVDVASTRIGHKLNRIGQELSDLKKREQDSPKKELKQIREGIRTRTANKTELTEAKAWCNAAIGALDYLSSATATATVSVSVDYSIKENKYPEVRILSIN